MALTYQAIATVTVGSGGAANIEFTSIPGSYTDLVIFLSTRSANTGNGSDQIFVTLNNSTSNFTGRYVTNNNNSINSADNIPRTLAFGNRNGSTANTFGNNFIYIPNYASSNYKSISVDAVTENNSATTGTFHYLSANLWSNAAAITSIKFEVNDGHNFLQYSTATLYGIKNS